MTQNKRCSELEFPAGNRGNRGLPLHELPDRAFAKRERELEVFRTLLAKGDQVVGHAVGRASDQGGRVDDRQVLRGDARKVRKLPDGAKTAGGAEEFGEL